MFAASSLWLQSWKLEIFWWQVQWKATGLQAGNSSFFGGKPRGKMTGTTAIWKLEIMVALSGRLVSLAAWQLLFFHRFVPEWHCHSSNSLLLFQDGTSLCSLEPCLSYLGKALFATFGEIPQRNTYARERSAERKSSGWIYVVHNGRKQQFYLWPVVIKCRISAENNYSCWLCIVR